MLTKEGKIQINCHLPVSTIMCNGEWLKSGIEYYFNEHPFYELFDHPQDLAAVTANSPKNKSLMMPTKKVFSLMPTPESFARALGFANFNSLKKAIENIDHPEDSRHYLLIGCSILADFLTRVGLTEKLNQSFGKFLMSAYLGISEKTEVYTQEDKRIVVLWGQAAPTIDGEASNRMTDLITDNNQLIEMKRLEDSLPEQMRLPDTYSPDVTRELVLNELL